MKEAALVPANGWPPGTAIRLLFNMSDTMLLNICYAMLKDSPNFYYYNRLDFLAFEDPTMPESKLVSLLKTKHSVFNPLFNLTPIISTPFHSVDCRTRFTFFDSTIRLPSSTIKFLSSICRPTNRVSITLSFITQKDLAHPHIHVVWVVGGFRSLTATHNDRLFVSTLSKENRPRLGFYSPDSDVVFLSGNMTIYIRPLGLPETSAIMITRLF